MYALMLVVIYLSFISLGLPDALLGSGWPVMQKQMNVPVSYAGILTMIIAGGTIVSSLLSDRLTRKFGAGWVTAISVLTTAVAMFGFSLSGTFWVLCIWAVPYGLGAGAVDAAINNYVALHYSSRHMNWLHCFWGVGATISPYIMGYYLSFGTDWNNGYRTVSFVQMALVVILFFSLPLWKKEISIGEQTQEPAKKLSQILPIKGIKYALMAFLGYCGLESATGLWAVSYLVFSKNIDPGTAAGYAALFYIGITAGRFLCGFISNRIGDRNMIRIGLSVILAGIILLLLPVAANGFALMGLIIIGLGCAPVYPAIIHATPSLFGKENSQAVIGIQMASAYTGATFMPPLFGFIAQYAGLGWYPVFLLVLLLMVICMTQLLNKTVDIKNNASA